MKATDFDATPVPDAAASYIDYTGVSPLKKQLNCDETWTLATTATGKHVKCVRQKVIIDGPMNKAGTTTAIKDDIDIQYREIAISAGWILF